MNRKILFVIPVIAVAAIISGCGYRIGYMGHPQLSTVAVAPVSNDTLSYNAAAMLRQKLTEVFTTDGTMKLKSISTADCIVYAKITNVTYAESSGHITDDDDFLPIEWRVTVTVEFSVVIPGRGKPLIGPKTVTGSAEFISDADLENSRTYGLRQALFDASRTIVSNVTEAW